MLSGCPQEVDGGPTGLQAVAVAHCSGTPLFLAWEAELAHLRVCVCVCVKIGTFPISVLVVGMDPWDAHIQQQSDMTCTCLYAVMTTYMQVSVYMYV